MRRVPMLALVVPALTSGCFLEPKVNPPADPIPLASISAGFRTCGLTAAGAAYCWGGVIGDGTSEERLVPTAVMMPAGVTFTSVNAGGPTCAVAVGGAAYCWGFTTADKVPTAVAMPSGVSFASVGAGFEHACGLATTGAVYCWGDNGLRQLGDGTDADSPTPVAVVMPGGVAFANLTVGAYHNCGRTSGGMLYCWGDNGSGSLGDGTTDVRSTPVPVTMPAGVTFTILSPDADGGHTCAATAAGAAYCWGLSSRGRLGNGTTDPYSVPTAVVMPAGVTFTSINTGWDASCGLTPAGAAFCWGRNVNGEVGDGTSDDRWTPTPVSMPQGVSFASLTAGYMYACGLTAEGQAWCWGLNSGGKLGDGTTTNRLVPVKVRQ